MPAKLADLAASAYAALNRGDLEAFLELVDPEVEFRSLIAEPEGDVYRGHEGVREWYHRVAEALGGLRFEAVAVHDFGDRAYAELVVTGTAEGVEIKQTMWQAFVARGSRAIWWGTFRTEDEARAALEAVEPGDA